MSSLDSPRDGDDLSRIVKDCYSTWGKTYYDEYYGDGSPYPPVHVNIVRNILQESGAVEVLDAGCGPASMLRELTDLNLDLYGFDLTPEMVTEGKRVFSQLGLPEERIWEGSVLDPGAFNRPGNKVTTYDAAICFGVLPHIPAENDTTVIDNLISAVDKGGVVVAEARNQFFSLFSLNRYSYDFFTNELLQQNLFDDRVDSTVMVGALDELKARFRMDLPAVRKGKSGEQGYDEILSRVHNPLVLRQQFEAAGLVDVEVLFYHYHSLPPMLEEAMPKAFRETSLAMEDPRDWRGYFMASAFLVAGKKV